MMDQRKRGYNGSKTLKDEEQHRHGVNFISQHDDDIPFDAKTLPQMPYEEYKQKSGIGIVVPQELLGLQSQGEDSDGSPNAINRNT